MRQRWVVALAVSAGVLFVAPQAARAQSTAVAKQVTCKDGTMSKGGQGACSSHGGIAPATPAASTMSTPGGGKVPNKAKAAPTTAGAATGAAATASADSTGAIAVCTDGMFWHGTSHQGACAGHKGVKRWLDKK